MLRLLCGPPKASALPLAVLDQLFYGTRGLLRVLPEPRLSADARRDVGPYLGHEGPQLVELLARAFAAAPDLFPEQAQLAAALEVPVAELPQRLRDGLALASRWWTLRELFTVLARSCEEQFLLHRSAPVRVALSFLAHARRQAALPLQPQDAGSRERARLLQSALNGYEAHVHVRRHRLQGSPRPTLKGTWWRR